jgi:hypothetical protein
MCVVQLVVRVLGEQDVQTFVDSQRKLLGAVVAEADKRECGL